MSLLVAFLPFVVGGWNLVDDNYLLKLSFSMSNCCFFGLDVFEFCFLSLAFTTFFSLTLVRG